MKVVLATQTTLMRVALEHLGSASRWTEIATLNGIVDPHIRDTVKLRIPTDSQGGGVQ